MGLCTALGFAIEGFRTFVYDNDPSKISLLNKGLSSFFESRSPFRGSKRTNHCEGVARAVHLRCLVVGVRLKRVELIRER